MKFEVLDLNQLNIVQVDDRIYKFIGKMTCEDMLFPVFINDVNMINVLLGIDISNKYDDYTGVLTNKKINLASACIFNSETFPNIKVIDLSVIDEIFRLHFEENYEINKISETLKIPKDSIRQIFNMLICIYQIKHRSSDYIQEHNIKIQRV